MQQDVPKCASAAAGCLDGGPIEVAGRAPTRRFIAAPEGIDEALWESIIELRLRTPGQTAKEVHAELQDIFPAMWGSLPVSEVRRTCSKLAKKAIENGGSLEIRSPAAGATAPPQTASAAVRELNVSIPGLSANHSLVRGDRLGTAAERGDLQQVRKLLKKGADPNFRNAVSGVTPLLMAAEGGHVDVVRVLLDAGADPEIGARDGHRPLHMASRCGHAATVALLCSSGKADMEAVAPMQDATALALATSFDRCEAMQALLAAGASANRPNSRGFSPLHLATTGAAVRALLSASADPNHSANPKRRTPLHTRAAAGCGASVMALLEGGAEPRLPDWEGRSAQELAAGKEAYDAILESLIAITEAEETLGPNIFVPANCVRLSVVARQVSEGQRCAADGAAAAGEGDGTALEQASQGSEHIPIVVGVTLLEEDAAPIVRDHLASFTPSAFSALAGFPIAAILPPLIAPVSQCDAAAAFVGVRALLPLGAQPPTDRQTDYFRVALARNISALRIPWAVGDGAGGGGDVNGPNPHHETATADAPEIVPEIAPEIVPEIAPEIVPEIAPEIVPEIALEVTEGGGGGDAGSTSRATRPPWAPAPARLLPILQVAHDDDDDETGKLVAVAAPSSSPPVRRSAAEHEDFVAFAGA